MMNSVSLKTTVISFLSGPRGKLWAQLTSLLLLLLLLYVVISTVTSLTSSAQRQASTGGKAFHPRPHPVPDIAAMHIFGDYQLTGLQAKNIPKSQLDLKLTGIFKGVDAKTSQVLIEQKGQAGKLYQVGDIIDGDAKIYEIFSDSVVLQRDGRLEKLTLSRKPLIFTPPSKKLQFEE